MHDSLPQTKLKTKPICATTTTYLIRRPDNIIVKTGN